MHDMTRDDVLKRVYRRLLDPQFAARLTVVDAAGERPIVAAASGDTVSSMLSEVAAIGGRANAVVAVLDGLIVFAVDTESTESARYASTPPPRLDASCTVGVLVARIIGDGGGEQTYRVVDVTARTHDASLLSGVA